MAVARSPALIGGLVMSFGVALSLKVYVDAELVGELLGDRRFSPIRSRWSSGPAQCPEAILRLTTAADLAA